ncbi:MAG: thioesterase family protein [Cyclobacteriaceae bacterium]
MYSHEVQIRVRYADTDQMGYVYYGNYAAYYEVARVESFRNLGFAYKQLEEAGVMMPVLELKCDYILPAKYDDMLTIKVTIPDLPKVRIKYLYEVRNEEGTLLNQGETTLAFINMKSGRPVRMPEVMGQLLEPYF